MPKKIPTFYLECRNISPAKFLHYDFERPDYTYDKNKDCWVDGYGNIRVFPLKVSDSVPPFYFETVLQIVVDE